MEEYVRADLPAAHSQPSGLERFSDRKYRLYNRSRRAEARSAHGRYYWADCRRAQHSAVANKREGENERRRYTKSRRRAGDHTSGAPSWCVIPTDGHDLLPFSDQCRKERPGTSPGPSASFMFRLLEK